MKSGAWTWAAWCAALAVSCGGKGGDIPDAGIEVDVPVTDAATVEAAEVDVAAPREHSGVSVRAQGDSFLVMENSMLRMVFDLDRATIRVEDHQGAPYLSSGVSSATLLIPETQETLDANCVEGWSEWSAGPVTDGLGTGMKVSLSCTTSIDGVQLATEVSLHGHAAWAMFKTTVLLDCPPCDGGGVECCDAGDGTYRIREIVPLGLGEGGSLFVGEEPDAHVMLDNGYDLYFDFAANVHLLRDLPSLLFGPGASSNWNAALFDPATGKSLVAGFLSATRGIGMVVFDFEPEQASSDRGRTGFTRFEGISYYMDDGRSLMPMKGTLGLESEVFYVDFDPPTPHEGLESFALRYAQRIGKTVTKDVPTGWNSWGGGGGSGGYGTAIDETLILQNLDAAAEDFLPWGMKYFMIDDGWQEQDGDWYGHHQRFPQHDGADGMRWLADRIVEKGFIPGIWISPFGAAKDSALAAEHPDWFAPLSDIGKGFVPDDLLILDLSRPEVLDWLEELFSRLTGEWGYKWIKLDFSYYALFTTGLWNQDMTPSEAYHKALTRIRQAIGGDTFLLTISATGLCFDMADGERITLDNEPWWGDPIGMGDQGIKATYVTTARRYYLNHRLWINHPDLLFFRDDFGLDLDEARAWASAVALTGGIVKLGESYLDMHEHPGWLDVVRRLLPVYPATGRPLDLFRREYPEVWDLAVEREGRALHVLGLFNWGKNRDIGAPKSNDEAPIRLRVGLAELGLDPGVVHLVVDAWEGSWSWIDSGEIDRTIEPRTSLVLLVQSPPALPAVVWTSRHLLGGAVEVTDEAYDPVTNELRFGIKAVPGHGFSLLVWQAGLEVTGSGVVGGHDLAVEEFDDGMARMTFVADRADPVLHLSFGL